MEHSVKAPSAALLERWAPVRAVEPGAVVRVHLASEVFGLWEAWEQEAGGVCEVPYWAVAWPAAIAFCRLLARQPEWVRGRTVVDLGCGGGTAAIAAALAGAARVIANDTDPIALEVAERNAFANRVGVELDARDLSQVGLPAGVEIVLAGDLFYERGPAARLEGFLRIAAARGVEVLVADAGRPFAPRLGVTDVAQEQVDVDDDLEGTRQRRVRILRLSGDGA